MATGDLRATAFRGDADVDELHSFFLPSFQFAGDTRWSFGTSLKSAYVNSFEFKNHAPVVQLWRDEAGAVQAVSRLALGTGEWFHLAAPAYRNDEVTLSLIRHADDALALLTDHVVWQTVRYDSSTDEIELLHRAGYTRDRVVEVYMVRSLDGPIEPAPLAAEVQIRLLDPTDPDLLHERALAQVDAFSAGDPTPSDTAWIGRSLPHQLGYGRPDHHPNVVAVDPAGAVLAFADVFVDRHNHVGEFEPVGTRTSAQRRGLAKAVTTRGLQEMRDLGMTQAVVRTGIDNPAAIAAYESVGFETTDHLIRFRRNRALA